jgi:hypothetical protein
MFIGTMEHTVHTTAAEAYRRDMLADVDGTGVAPTLLSTRAQDDIVICKLTTELPAGEWVVISSEEEMAREEHESQRTLGMSRDWLVFMVTVRGREIVYITYIGEGGGLWYYIVPVDMVADWPRF